MLRPLALAVVLLLLGAAPASAQEQQFRIVVVPDLSTDEFRTLAAQGAVGLLVPANGETTSAEQARAALVTGDVRNAFLDDGIPAGPPLVTFETATEVPTTGPVIVVELPQGGVQPNEFRYPIAVLGDGYEGLLTSPSTRLPGVVSIADIAPTALGEEDGLGSRADDNAAARVLELDQLIREKKDARLAGSLLVGALILLLTLFLPRAALLAYATTLVANLALGASETSTMWVVLLALSAAVAVAIPLAFVLRSFLALGMALTGVLGVYLVAFLIDGTWIAYSPWGPAQAGRFYGITNLLGTILLVPALAGAAFVARRFGVAGFGFVALLALVLVAGGRFGADGGGAVVFAVGFAVLVVLLWSLRGRALAVAIAGTVVVCGGLIALDAATGGSSHVTRAIGDGPGELASRLQDRLVISWERATLGIGPALMVLVCLGILIALVVVTLRSDAPLTRRALPLAFAAAIGVSFLVNDAPNDVAAAGLVGYATCTAVMLRAR